MKVSSSPKSKDPYHARTLTQTSDSNRFAVNGLGLVLTLIFFFVVRFSFATHVVGGGITYQHLEGSNYLLTVKLYRDCTPGTYGLPGSIDLQIRNADGSNPPTTSYNLPLVINDTISPAIPACVFDPGICVEEALYQDIVSFPEGVGGYHLYFTICCRNATIVNIIAPLAANETFYAWVPDLTLYPGNSSPVFNYMPPVYVCSGESLDLDFSAYDIDGDSLDYYFYTPFDGFNGTGITYGAGVPPNNINISPVNWNPGFGATDPLDPAPGLLPGLTISSGGLITGIPTAAGQYVVGVMVDEYRDGVLIGRISRDFQFNVLNCPPPLEAIIDVPDVCNGLTVDFDNTSTGIISNYWWDFGTGDPADSSTVFEPTFTYSAPGIYTVTLIVEKGTQCADTTTYTFEILEPITFTVNVDSVDCSGAADGGADVLPTDGTLDYLWSTAETSYAIDGLPIGPYWVEATNAIGCVDTQFFVVEEPDPLDVTYVLNEPSCFEGLDGSIQAIASGGVGPYTYEWYSPAVSGDLLSSIGAGTYAVEITDANGCVEIFEVSLGEPQELELGAVVEDVTCFGGNDGSITLIITGGTGAYSIDWLTLPYSASIINDLSAGDYPVEVTDENGCSASLTVTINQPDTFEVNLIVTQEEACSAGIGELLAGVIGGVGTLTYDWDPDVAAGPTATGLTSGLYGVVVTDEDGCQAGSAIFLPDHLTGEILVDDMTPVSCAGGSDGTITVSMDGGSGPFDYNWSCACSETNVASGLSAGDYWLEVVDDNGCIDSLYFTIDELPELTLELLDKTDPLCHGDWTGAATVLAEGGTYPYSYLWNTVPPLATPNPSGIPAGDYIVTVTDLNGCETSLDVSIVEPDPLYVHPAVLSSTLCYGDSSGVISAFPTGGTAPYEIYWTDLMITADTVFGVPAGLYDLTVTDANGCTADSTLKVSEYEHVVASIVGDSAYCPGDMVDFFVMTNDLIGLYNYYWYVDGVYMSEGPFFSYEINDTVMISIALYSDAGCDPIFDTIVTGPIMHNPSNLNLIASPDTVCQGSEAELIALVDDMTDIASIYWNDPSLSGLGPHIVTPDAPTVYTVTLVNVCGDELSASAPVHVHMPPAAEIYADGLQGCDQVEVSFDFNYELGPYDLTDVSWSISGDDYPTVEPIVTFYGSGSIHAELYLTFSNGCTFKYEDMIGTTVFESPEADFYFNPDPAIQFEITEFVDISKGNPNYWEWYLEGSAISNEERPSWTFDELGEYTVMQIIEDHNGCRDTMVHVIEVIGDFTVYVPNVFTPDGNGLNNSFRPIMMDVLEEGYEFLIFNRWGEVIYQTNNLYDSWDGTYNGETVKDDVYVWKVLVRDQQSQEHEYNGHVTVLR